MLSVKIKVLTFYKYFYDLIVKRSVTERTMPVEIDV